MTTKSRLVSSASMDSDPIPDARDALEGVDHYLSVYLAAPGPESIFHSSRHDHAIALWRKQGRAVELVSYWELERLSGVKHHDLALGSMGSNLAVIEELLSEEALTLADISEIWGTPGIATTDVLERRFGSLEFPVPRASRTSIRRCSSTPMCFGCDRSLL